MPDFSVEAWTSFKEQFLSVIRFIMYCFDLCFDTFRSNPLLYAAFFFPIFALAFFAVFELFLHIAPFYPATVSGKHVGALSSFRGIRASTKQQGIRSQNLAAPSRAKAEARLQSAAGGRTAGDSIKHETGKAVQLPPFASVGTPSSLSTNKGSTGFMFYAGNVFDNAAEISAQKINDMKQNRESKNNPSEIYTIGPKNLSSETELTTFDSVAGPKEYTKYTSLSSWLPEPEGKGNKSANLDIDAD